MKHYFWNPGLLNLAFLSLHGVSIKETDDPFGKFGTGMKYAVAGVLRNGGKISLRLGNTRYDFRTWDEEIRGQMVQRVAMHTLDDESASMRHLDLPFTTTLGEHWEPWMLFRELYTNAMDEGGGYTSSEHNQAVNEDATIFCVEFPAFDELLNNTNKYFIMDDIKADPIIRDEHMAVYKNEDVYEGMRGNVYLKGIRVADGFAHTYLTTHERVAKGLTEDRTLSREWVIPEEVVGLLDKYGDSTDLVNYYIASRGYSEFYHLPTNVNERHNDAFLYALRNGALGDDGAGASIARCIAAKLGKNTRPVNATEQRALDVAITHLRDMGYINMNEYTFEVLEGGRLTNDMMGMAYTARPGVILLGDAAFKAGLRELIKTVLEEHIHHAHAVADRTHAMQEAMLSEMLSIYTYTKGIVL